MTSDNNNHLRPTLRCPVQPYGAPSNPTVRLLVDGRSEKCFLDEVDVRSVLRGDGTLVDDLRQRGAPARVLNLFVVVELALELGRQF